MIRAAAFRHRQLCLARNYFRWAPLSRHGLARRSHPSSPEKKSCVASLRLLGQIASAPGVNDGGVLEVRRRRE